MSWPIIKSITTPKVLNSIFNLGKRGYCSQMNEYSKPHSNFMGGLQCTRLFLNSSILVYVHSLFLWKRGQPLHEKTFRKPKKMNSFFYKVRILILLCKNNKSIQTRHTWNEREKGNLYYWTSQGNLLFSCSLNEITSNFVTPLCAIKIKQLAICHDKGSLVRS